ncbi:hypothetical protein ES703_59739 [subsurface metagenome]
MMIGNTGFFGGDISQLTREFDPDEIFVSESDPSDKGQISLSKVGYISSIKSL